MEPDNHSLVSLTSEAVGGAATLDEALDAVVRVLRSRFGLWHASFCAYFYSTGNFRVLASWTVSDSVFEAGTEVSATISQTMAAIVRALQSDDAISFVVGAEAESLVDELLAGEGVASAVCVPVLHDGRAMLFLALGAGTKDAFQDSGPAFFSALSIGIGDSVQRLLGMDDGPETA
jgi:hypothetical protein